jgi:hypothetical protein
MVAGFLSLREHVNGEFVLETMTSLEKRDPVDSDPSRQPLNYRCASNSSLWDDTSLFFDLLRFYLDQ